MNDQSMKPVKSTRSLVWIGIGLVVLFWILESAIHVVVFHEGGLIRQMFWPGVHEIWMRLLVVSIFIGFAIYTQFIVSQRMRAEEATKLAHAELNQIFETAADGMRLVDKDFNVLRVNETFVEQSGLSKDEAIGKKCYEVFHGPACHTPDCPLTRIVGGEERVEYDADKERHDGKKVPYIVTATAFRRPDGELLGILEDFKDITKRKQADEALRQSENWYRTLLEHLPQKIFHKDRESVYVSCNDNYARDLKIKPEEIVGRTDYEFFPKELADKYRGDDKRIVTLATTEDIEEKYIQDGQEVWVHTVKTPIKDEKGNIAGVLGIFWDITKRKRAEGALRQSEERYRVLFNSSNDAVFVHQPTPDGMPGKFIEVNDVACQRYGYTREEFLNLSPLDISAPEEVADISGRVEKLFSEEHVVFEKVQVSKDGKRIPVEISSHLFNLRGQPTVLSAVRDISGRKRAEERIRTLTQQLIRTQESERHSISRDLHDSVAQNLSTLKIGLDTLFHDQPNTPSEMRQRVAQLSAIVHQNIVDVRDLAYNLRPPGLDQWGLVETVLRYCEDFSERNAVEVEFFSVGLDQMKLDFDTEIALYRLIQEAMNNIGKHSHASHVTVTLSASFPRIILRIEDNGRGFEMDKDLDQATREQHMGLQIMRERVALLDGTMKIESRLNQGTKIWVEVPYREKSIE